MGGQVAIREKPGASQAVKDERADGGLPPFGGLADLVGLFSGAAQQHGGPGSGWTPGESFEAVKIDVAKVRSFLSTQFPQARDAIVKAYSGHKNVHDIAADGTALPCGSFANLAGFFFGAVNEQDRSMPHKTSIYDYIRGCKAAHSFGIVEKS
jgi:hypothetical protein